MLKSEPALTKEGLYVSNKNLKLSCVQKNDGKVNNWFPKEKNWNLLHENRVKCEKDLNYVWQSSGFTARYNRWILYFLI